DAAPRIFSATCPFFGTSWPPFPLSRRPRPPLLSRLIAVLTVGFWSSSTEDAQTGRSRLRIKRPFANNQAPSGESNARTFGGAVRVHLVVQVEMVRETAGK